jgi:hypothetical protein
MSCLENILQIGIFRFLLQCGLPTREFFIQIQYSVQVKRAIFVVRSSALSVIAAVYPESEALNPFNTSPWKLSAIESPSSAIHRRAMNARLTD